MMTNQEKVRAKDLLQLMPFDELEPLTGTVTSYMIVPQNKEDAINAIVLHSMSAQELLGRAKIKKRLLYVYLTQNGVNAAGMTKTQLASRIVARWRAQNEPPCPMCHN